MRVGSGWITVGLVILLGSVACGSSDVGDAPQEQLGPALVFEEPCDSCSIELTPIAILGSINDSASIRPDAMRGCMVDRLSSGAFVVSGVVGGGRLLVFPDSGGSSSRSIGRFGQGPGEFGESSRIIVGVGDTLHVLDDANGRVQVLLADGSFVRSFPLPDGFGPVLLLPDGDYVFHVTPTGADARLFQRFDPTGGRLTEWGMPSDHPFDVDQWVLGNGPGDDIWAASIWSYTLELWRGEERSGVLRRRPPWFDSEGPPSLSEIDEFYRTRASSPLVRAIWQDDDGAVRAVLQVPDPGWTPGMRVRMTPDWGRRTFDSVIEIIDEGSAVASYRTDELLGATCTGDMLYAVRETTEGDTRLVVFDERLVRSP